MKVKSYSIPALVVLMLTAVFIAVSCTPGQLAQKDCVVILGDSIFALSGQINKDLQDLSGQQWRTYYVSGAQMDGGMVRTIPQQYDQAKRAGAIRTVLFDGGGNDVLIGAPVACRTSYPNGQLGKACYDMIDKTEAVNVKFWEQMIADGVQNIVQQGYYNSSDQGLWVVAEVFQNRTIEEWNKVAAKHPDVKMIYVDPRDNDYFDKSRAASYTIIDGIHPTAASSAQLAGMDWDAMVANNIEQTDSCSGSGSSSGGGGCN